MSSFTDLVTEVSRALRDPNNITFRIEEVADMISAGLTEVGRISPERFQQDIVPVAEQLEYPLMRGDPEIEVVKVEVWHIATDDSPFRYMTHFRSGAKEYTNSSDVGWRVWSGTLFLSNPQERWLDPDVHVLRIWGYTPYEQVTFGAPMPVSNELEKAIKVYARLEGLRRLAFDRDLFTQWQTKANSTDATPGAILSALNVTESEWNRLAKQLYLIREGQ